MVIEADLVHDGLATARVRSLDACGTAIKIVRFKIRATGRQAVEG
jgi:hypothetical protein